MKPFLNHLVQDEEYEEQMAIREVLSATNKLDEASNTYKPRYKISEIIANPSLMHYLTG
eukprot:Pgem_evm1s10221